MTVWNLLLGFAVCVLAVVLLPSQKHGNQIGCSCVNLVLQDILARQKAKEKAEREQAARVVEDNSPS